MSNSSMKTPCISALALLVISSQLFAAEHPAPPKLSSDFERMKGLVGTWKGKADMGQGMTEFTVEYRLISGGSAIEERIFAGTPKEMLTIYHDRKGKLALTHYCMLGNQPGMALKSADSKSLQFDFDPKCGVDDKSEMHMHALTITFEDPDTIVQDWKLYQDGKMKESHPFTLKRVKA
jgi:hypothetical protein